MGGVPASTRDIKRKDGRLQGQSGNAPLSPQTTYPLRRRWSANHSIYRQAQEHRLLQMQPTIDKSAEAPQAERVPLSAQKDE